MRRVRKSHTPPVKSRKMTVQQLIDALSKAHPDSIVEIAAKTYTQRYPSFYQTITSTLHNQNYESFIQIGTRREVLETFYIDRTRIYINLPEGYIISQRKKK